MSNLHRFRGAAVNTRARSSLIASLLAVAAVVALAGGVLAKGPDAAGSVTLAQPIPRDAAPGSTISVTFTATVDTATGPSPVYGSPMFVRLIAPDGTTSEGDGQEQVQGSGTYTADVIVPAGGINSAEFGLRGFSQNTLGNSVREDELFEVHGWLFTTTGVVAGSPAAGGSSGAVGIDGRMAILVGLVAIAAIGFVIGLRRGMRRRRLVTTA
jgi:hypothetical protein